MDRFTAHRTGELTPRINGLPFGFYEFFAGGGMARIGLGKRWKCLFANELCPKKANAYKLNFGASPELIVDDVANIALDQLGGSPVLAWASFPCQDLSLAGNGKGLAGERSGTFWPFWRLMIDLQKQGRSIPIILLENVPGAITSNRGRDFHSILSEITSAGYLVGPMVIDAVHFIPQSRLRLFIVAVKSRLPIPERVKQVWPDDLWHSYALQRAYDALPDDIKKAWIWWRMPAPPEMPLTLADLIEECPQGVDWHRPDETNRLLSLMSDTNLQKVKHAQSFGKKVVGTVYKRTRPNEAGIKVQRAEVRFDQISGCLRTPLGGSSRQTILIVEGKNIRSRLLSPKEAARLMGLPERYKLPPKYNEAYHLAGDGLVVPVVTWLERHLLRPLAAAQSGLSTNRRSVS
jgi:DNA (cytosine-5)-methyltransferase 1